MPIRMANTNTVNTTESPHMISLIEFHTTEFHTKNSHPILNLILILKTQGWYRYWISNLAIFPADPIYQTLVFQKAKMEDILIKINLGKEITWWIWRSYYSKVYLLWFQNFFKFLSKILSMFFEISPKCVLYINLRQKFLKRRLWKKNGSS